MLAWVNMVEMNEVCTHEQISRNLGITTIMWNCRSIFNKQQEIFHILNASICEIAIFVESWLTDLVNNDMVSHQGYNILRQDRNIDSNKVRGGSIIVYYKDHMDIVSCDTVAARVSSLR